jgi:hypothetical protein
MRRSPDACSNYSTKYRISSLLSSFPFSFRSDTLSETTVRVSRQAGVRARLTTRDEARGEDGRGFAGPGLDHGVFIPFRLMFGEELGSVPIVQASIDGSLSPESNWNLGKAITKLRCVQHDFTTADALIYLFSSAVYLAYMLSCLPLGRKES